MSELKMGRRNIGAMQNRDNIPKDDVRKSLGFSMKVAKLCPDRVKSPEELAERFDKVFELAFQEGVLPRYEHLVLASGLPRSTFYDYGNENSNSSVAHEYLDIIKRAKIMIASSEANLAATGKIPAPVYIFREKNYSGLRDVQEIQATNTYNTDPKNPEEVVKALPDMDEKNFIEIKDN